MDDLAVTKGRQAAPALGITQRFAEPSTIIPGTTASRAAQRQPSSSTPKNCVCFWKTSKRLPLIAKPWPTLPPSAYFSASAQ